MKKCILLAFSLLLTYSAFAQGTSLTKMELLGIPFYVVIVDTSEADVTAQLPEGFYAPFYYRSERFQSMLQRSRPEVAITGTYFNTRNFKPIGDIVVDGGTVHTGVMGTAFIIDKDRNSTIRDVKWNNPPDWSQTKLVVACGPRLVEDGDLVPNMIERARDSGFSERAVFTWSRRIALGVISQTQIAFVITLKKANIWTMAKIMKGLGCEEAMSLDGGSSCGLYYQGKLLVKPHRNPTNIIVVNNSKDFNTNFAAIPEVAKEVESEKSKQMLFN